MPTTLLVNGTDLTDLGLVVENIEPWLSGPRLTRALAQIPGYTGALVGEAATSESRVITATTLARTTTWAARKALLDQLSDLCMTGVCELVTADDTSRVMYGLYTESVSDLVAPRLVNTEGRMTVGWVCPDAAKYDIQPRGYALSSTPKAIPLGTLPSGGIWRIMGALSGACTLTYRNLLGTALGTLTVSGTLTSSEFLDVDLDQRTITKWSSAGVASDAYSWKSASTYWFRLDPGDGDRTTGVWGTLEQSAATGIFMYRRAWAN